MEEKRGKKVIGSYCKNPRGCKGVVVMAEDAMTSEAVCSLCATSFCAACDLPPHAPATCDMVAQWEEKGGYLETGRAEDAEARKLKHLTTKPCPRCGVRIEKNGGCPVRVFLSSARHCALFLSLSLALCSPSFTSSVHLYIRTQHMTCVQPNCKYQFCWECSGEYHTSSTCSRPKVKIDNNAILLFDELDRQCANFFLARKVAMKGKRDSDNLLFQADKPRDVTVCRTMAEGWSILAEAQSALAHTSILMYFVKSAKIVFVYEHQKQWTQQLQQKFEEEWTTMDRFPVTEARLAIQDLHTRLRDYLLTIQAEIVLDRSTNTPIPPPTGSLHPSANVAGGSSSSTATPSTPAPAATTTTPGRGTPSHGSPVMFSAAAPGGSPSLSITPSSPGAITTTSLLPRSALLFESKKSPSRVLFASTRSRSNSLSMTTGASAITIDSSTLVRQSSGSSNHGGHLSNFFFGHAHPTGAPTQSDYYDLMDRLSTFSLQEKSDLAGAIFGDAFGGSHQVYRASL